MPQPLLFSIIIANYNKADTIAALLSSIYDSYPHGDFELLFMDDASTDSSCAEAQRFPVRLFSSTINVGPATQRNRGAQEARGEFLLFVDSDVILPPGTLPEFRNICLTREFAAVSGMEVLPPVTDNWVGEFRVLQVHDYFGEYRDTEGFIAAWGTTFGAIRRELFLSIGGFAETFRGADVEDQELAARIQGSHAILFASQLGYRHSHPGALGFLAKQFRRASQMVRIKESVVIGNSLLFRTRFKLGHILSALILVGFMVSIVDQRWICPLLAAVIIKLYVNNHLFRKAYTLNGAVFTLYCFALSLVMGFIIVSGALYGKMRRT